VILPSVVYDSAVASSPLHGKSLSTHTQSMAQDEAALTEYLERRQLSAGCLAQHLDGCLQGADCLTTDASLDRSKSHSSRGTRQGVRLRKAVAVAVAAKRAAWRSSTGTATRYTANEQLEHSINGSTHIASTASSCV